MAQQTLTWGEAHDIRVALYVARHVAEDGHKLGPSSIGLLTKALAILGEPEDAPTPSTIAAG